MRNAAFVTSIVFVLFTILIILSTTALNVHSNQSTTDQNNVRASLQDGNPSSGNLKVSNHQMTKPLFGNWVVKGQAKNIGSGTFRYATINVNFYKDGNLIYFGYANLKNLASGEVQDFEVIYPGTDTPNSYQVEIGPSL